MDISAVHIVTMMRCVTSYKLGKLKSFDAVVHRGIQFVIVHFHIYKHSQVFTIKGTIYTDLKPLLQIARISAQLLSIW